MPKIDGRSFWVKKKNNTGKVKFNAVWDEEDLREVLPRLDGLYSNDIDRLLEIYPGLRYELELKRKEVKAKYR